MEFRKSWPTSIYIFCQTRLRFHTYIYIGIELHNTTKIRTQTENITVFIYQQKKEKKNCLHSKVVQLKAP